MNANRWLLRGVSDLRGNLAAGARLALMLPVSAADFRGGPGRLAPLAAGLALLVGLLSYVAVPDPKAFDTYGVPIYCTYLLALVSVPWLVFVVGGIAGRAEDPSAAILAALALPLLLVFALWAFSARTDFDTAGRLRETLFALWTAVIMLRGIRLHARLGWRPRAAGGIAAFAGAALLLALPVYPLWYEEGEDGRVSQAVDVEQTYYQQPAMMRRLVAELQPERPGVTDLYVVSVGGYAHERVFLREATYVRRMMDRYFGTAGRSAVLANHPERVRFQPMANSHNLRALLWQIGKKMNPDEDVLFLYVTSHGSPDQTLSMEFWPLQLNDLDADSLLEMLDDAGIKWRVLVLSGCYSGSFIPVLEAPNTLLITAADADSTSFGCADHRHLTYFGEALFQEALPQTQDLVRAFEYANDWVSSREREEGKKPSSPQIRIGSEVTRKLAELRPVTRVGAVD